MSGSSNNNPHTRHWWRQRVTALINIPLTFWFIISIAVLRDAEFATIVAWMKQPFVGAMLALMLLNTSYHFYLGLQVAIEDYISAEKTRKMVLLGLAIFALSVVVNGLYFIYKISFEG